MLARPSIARPIVSRITSFVFYAGPEVHGRAEAQHPVLLRGGISLPRYYLCCLPVLPSHVLGASAWEEASESAEEEANQSFNLRRFRYSYYWGLLRVDTRHARVPGEEDAFRLVEFISGWRRSAMALAAVFYAMMLHIAISSGILGNLTLAISLVATVAKSAGKLAIHHRIR